MELSGSNNKQFLIISQKKALLIFRKMKASKRFLIFQETELSYISENFLYFRKKLSESGKIEKIYPQKISYISGNATF